MRVLNYGIPFDTDYSSIERYIGPHEIRTLGSHESSPFAHANRDHDFYIDSRHEDFPAFLKRVAPEWQPDLALFWAPDKHPPPLGVEHSPVRTVAVASDWGYRSVQLNGNLGRYDVVLSDKAGTRALKQPCIVPHYLDPIYAYSSARHYPVETEKDLDVVYIGALDPWLRPERAEYLDRLARLGGEFRIKLGTGFHGEDYCRQLCRAHIVFNYSVRGELNLRVWETIACGSLLFLEEHNPEIRDYFTDGVDVVLYNKHNFEEKIRYYLAHPEEAAAIAARGHALAPRFSGEARFDTLIEKIASAPDSGRPFLKLTDADQGYADLRQYVHADQQSCAHLLSDHITSFQKQFPGDPRGHALQGAALCGPGGMFIAREHRYEQALKAYGRAAQLAPNEVIFYLGAATAAHELGLRDQQALLLRASLNKSDLSHPECVAGTFQDPFWVRWIMCYAEHKHALTMLHAEAHARLAQLLVESMPEQAEAHARSALALDPKNASVVPALSDILWALGRRDEAADLLLDRLASRPLDLQYRITLARRLDELGRAEDTRRVVEDAEDLTTTFDIGAY